MSRSCARPVRPSNRSVARTAVTPSDAGCACRRRPPVELDPVRMIEEHLAEGRRYDVEIHIDAPAEEVARWTPRNPGGDDRRRPHPSRRNDGRTPLVHRAARRDQGVLPDHRATRAPGRRPFPRKSSPARGRTRGRELNRSPGGNPHQPCDARIALIGAAFAAASATSAVGSLLHVIPPPVHRWTRSSATATVRIVSPNTSPATVR